MNIGCSKRFHKESVDNKVQRFIQWESCKSYSNIGMQYYGSSGASRFVP